MYYYGESCIVISNYNSISLPQSKCLQINNRRLESYIKVLNTNVHSTSSFRAEEQTQFNFWNQILNSLKDKFAEIKYKHALIIGAGSVFKTVIGNFHATDGKYFTIVLTN